MASDDSATKRVLSSGLTRISTDFLPSALAAAIAAVKSSFLSPSHRLASHGHVCHRLLVLPFKRSSSGEIQRANQIFQGAGRHRDSNSEKKKRGDDRSDSNCSEPTAEPAFGFAWMVDRDILDQESDHIAAGRQHHPDYKAREGGFECRIVPGYAFRLMGVS
jgi:hypothetical protein